MASTLLSPGVEIQERDLTIGSIETVEVNVGAIAGAFSKGPVLKPVRITSGVNTWLARSYRQELRSKRGI